MVRTLPKFLCCSMYCLFCVVLCIVCVCVCVCKCVLYYCHRVAIQLQLTNMSYIYIYISCHIISYHIIYLLLSNRAVCEFKSGFLNRPNPRINVSHVIELQKVWRLNLALQNLYQPQPRYWWLVLWLFFNALKWTHRRECSGPIYP